MKDGGLVSYSELLGEGIVDKKSREIMETARQMGKRIRHGTLELP